MACLLSAANAQQSDHLTEPILLPPQSITPPLGYSVYSSPDPSQRPLGIVRPEDATEDIQAAAFVRTRTGRWFLTPEGLARHQAGLQTEWIFIEEVSDLPEFRVPAYLADASIVSEETAFERFEAKDFAGARRLNLRVRVRSCAPLR